MLTQRFFLPTLILVSLCGCASSRWEPLFDGRSLAGWTRHGEADFRVDHGEIVGASKPDVSSSYLCTEREFADFVLEYDFKVDPRLNSGVQIRSNTFPNYNEGRVHGYQVEIDPSERAYTGGIYDEGRRGWIYELKKDEPARKAFKQNQWNHVRVEAKGDSIKTWLNGAAAADLHDSLTHTGFIGLQVHTTKETTPLEARFKNVQIRAEPDTWMNPGKNVAWLLRQKHCEKVGMSNVLDGATGSDNWEHAGKPGSSIEWAWQNGDYLEVKPGSGNIVTKKQFGDARFHVEFCTDDNGKTGQENGNSGVYLQNRYEVQVLNSTPQPPTDDNCGAIYKIKAPDWGTTRKAGEWQTYDIWFTAARFDDKGAKTSNARMTVYHNGTRIHDNVEVPHPTGAGQPETAPPGGGPLTGPLLLQDHGNKIRFRNIWVSTTDQK